jgi:hypothetical protein
MSCCVCQKSKTGLVCGLCKEDVCKPCTEFLDADSFSFLKNKPEHLTSGAFCVTCFNNTISAELSQYEATVEQAKNILVFDSTQGKETRFIKRKEAQLKVEDCPDRDETIMRLAFFAVELGFNAIIDVDLKSKKIKDGRYQHLIWTGTAVPANVTDKKLLKDRSLWSNPN